jgi:hypothetical protein
MTSSSLDGVGNAEPLSRSRTLQRVREPPWRIVTVYERVLADLRTPGHFSRDHGPPGDPDVYLASMRERVADVGLSGVDTVAIPDDVSVSAGLEDHLANSPARLLVLGGGHRGVPVAGSPGRLDNATLPP